MRAMGGECDGLGEGSMQRSGSRDNKQVHTPSVGRSNTKGNISSATSEHPPQHVDGTHLACVSWNGDGGSTMLLHQPSPPTWGPSPFTVPLHQPSSTTGVHGTTGDLWAPSEAARRSSVARPMNDTGRLGNGSGCDDGSGSGECEWVGGCDGVGIGGDHACIHIHLPLQAELWHDEGGQRLGLFGVILCDLVWVMSAFVTFLDGSAGISGRQRRRAARRTRRRMMVARAVTPPPVTRRGIRRFVAVAPPIVGRMRLRRRWIGRGTWHALRLDGTSRRAAARRVGARCTHDSRDAPRVRRMSRCPTSAYHHDGPDGGNDERDGDGLTAAEACCVGMGTLRVGEASNPGHAPMLGWVTSRLASVLEYAKPGKTGFHGTHTAGCGSEDDGPPGEPFALRVATANTTGWRPLQRYVLSTDAHVIFAQEHRLLPESIPAASAWARAQGWKSVWAPAKLGKGGGAAAGTVILARDFVGLRHPDRGSAVVAEAHVAAAVIEPPSCRPFMGYAAYLHDGQGLSRANLDLAANIGAHWESQEDSTLQLMIRGGL